MALDRQGLVVVKQELSGQAALMERIPILRVREFSLVSIQVDITIGWHSRYRTISAQRSSARTHKGVLIDISSLEIVDSFLGRMLASIASISRLLERRRCSWACSPPSLSPWWSSD